MNKPSLIMLLMLGGSSAAMAVEPFGGTTLSPSIATPPSSERQLREMNALTYSPYTVDAGHFQIESYLAGYTYTRDTSYGGDTRINVWSFGSTTLKYGVLSDLDLELEITPYTHVRTEDRMTGTVTKQRGFGDISLKAKLNLWGNDGGSSALALLPSIKFPTNQDELGNDAIEGGLAVPISLELPLGWWLGLSPELSVVQGSIGDGYTAAFGNTAYLWHQIAGDLSGYVEFVNWTAFDAPEDWYGTVDVGFTYMITRDIQLDAGVCVGVTRSAPDVNPFLGLSVRF